MNTKIISSRQCKPVSKGFITASTLFATGSGKKIQFMDDKTVQIRVASDPIGSKYTVGYDYYFHIALTNNSKYSERITLEALRPDTDPDLEDWFPTKAPIFCSNDGKSWYSLTSVKATKNHLDYKCPVTIKSGETLQIANNIPINPELVTKRLQSIAEENSDTIKYYEIGDSVKGFPIPLIEIDYNPSKKKDRFLIWAGIHPSEPDPLANFWAIDWLLSNDPNAIKARDTYIFNIIPMVNPDGFRLGTSGCNANGINIFWNFFKNGHETCPESTALWKWIQRKPPQVSLDIHAYIYQVNKQARPYIGSLTLYPPEVRRVAWKMQRAIIKLCHGEVVDGKTADCETSIAPHLKNKYGTLTLSGYHLHFADGPEKCKKLLINTLEIILKTTSSFQPLNERLILKNSSSHVRNFIWRVIELFFDKIPRRIQRNLKSEPTEREIIDKSFLWEKYLYDIPQSEPVARVSSDFIG